MAKFALRLKARKLRARGESVRDIAKLLNVSKGTVSLWVRDIILSIEQIERLKQKELKGAERGRALGSLKLKQHRLNIINQFNEKGIRNIGMVNDRELLLTGLALYWAEGSKRLGRLEICNSDPYLIKFALFWLERCFGITKDNIACYVGINEVHRKREEEVKQYWAELTRIPPSNFQKTSFKATKLSKVYDNFTNHFGTLTLRPRKTTYLHYEIMGLISGLKQTSFRLI